ncbi:SigE family RNA polymerase sigma factor [Kibdelosporangium phytohabitans]|uniref:RNA polymerase subunit sigma-24 n=1 Tax=Kibdelosporangium phytohabitans TaxID=860235 RepID=A0A0N9I6R7_9PSEU|nr:SigE family RNA polymerase sigma factor [Kibdelosporangium phytohabitans]ALG14584.1 RNA polymerase subunit sigma-24 [Kibdelosporangium phytohabitans]MBE1467784.1 RNA polymerase sigma-70 factor (sigma-E family) [Kibdelosporangium phytohabitans]
MRSKDDARFREFARSRALSLRRTAYLLCGDWHLAEDLAQTTLIKLYGVWARLRDSAVVDNYARRVLLNSWLDEQRKPWRRRENRDGVVPELPHSDPVSGVSDVLVSALAQLPARQRAAVALRYCQDLSIFDVASVLRCSEGNVKSLTSRGLDRLREIVAELQMAEGGL